MVILKNPLLYAFEMVAEHKTLHAAAKQLRLTQVALTKRIQSLENLLGTTLFLRSRRGMSITEEGLALLQFCKETGELEGAFFSQIKGELRREINLTLIGPTSAISTRVARACVPLYTKHPFLRLHLKADDHSNLVEILRRGQADLALVPPSVVPNEFESKILRPERYLLMGSRHWKGRPLKDVLKTERIVDFHESDETTLKYLKIFGLDSYLEKTRLYVNDNQALVQYLATGVGFGTLSESVVEPHLKSGSLIKLNHGKSMEEPLSLVWLKRSRNLKYFDDLIRSII